MPIYEYECRHCGHHFDNLQKLSDPDPTECPTCHTKQQLHRMLSAPAFRLAGTGWYETDFKTPGEHRHNLAGDAGDHASGSTSHHDTSHHATESSGTPATTTATPAPTTPEKKAAAAG